MLIRWLNERDIETVVRWGEAEHWLIDAADLARIRQRFFYLCLGAYDGDFLQAAITGYLHEKSAWLGNFITAPDVRKKGIGKRLFEAALAAAQNERSCVKLHAAPQMAAFYARYGFKETGLAGRFVLSSRGTSFTFTAQQARELETQNTAGFLKLDAFAFGEDRSLFLLEDMVFKSSLMLESAHGVMHTRVIGNHVFLGPWLVKAAAYMDAELLLRGAIYLRGMKPLAVDVPLENKDAVNLLTQYGFEKKGETVRMALGECPGKRLEDVYGFATAGSHG